MGASFSTDGHFIEWLSPHGLVVTWRDVNHFEIGILDLGFDF